MGEIWWERKKAYLFTQNNGRNPFIGIGYYASYMREPIYINARDSGFHNTPAIIYSLANFDMTLQKILQIVWWFQGKVVILPPKSEKSNIMTYQSTYFYGYYYYFAAKL